MSTIVKVTIIVESDINPDLVLKAIDQKNWSDLLKNIANLNVEQPKVTKQQEAEQKTFDEAYPNPDDFKNLEIWQRDYFKKIDFDKLINAIKESNPKVSNWIDRAIAFINYNGESFLL